ncbi:hypothetical protein AMTRI_Chr11g101400 [Amborella trichopoda]|uniref:Uncharacterized protein n=1 Tax=Amborella trichopoda TaxID=13333 RepID=W1NRN1_AMBTC|nr:glucuronoxylan 4-O-methyltransferase 1 [Amborella trichopoda]ERM99646.1 hypothetical protein AMTR_s00099p00012720 [Amborella trichopoda]|eukprot:XP_006836793.1 glucuronoxylan 4-O-methyltransferase 1 [Amborella trichopoda]
MGFFQSSIRSKTHQSSTLKLLLLVFSLVFLLLFILRSNLSSPLSPSSPSSSSKLSSSSTSVQSSSSPLEASSSSPSPTLCKPSSSCTKLPEAIVQSLIHYATSNTTPQQTIKEISITSSVLLQKSPCNFLIFGLGHDSLLWSSLNYNGRTVFLEEDKAWIQQITQKIPNLEAYHLQYTTRVSEADELLKYGETEECRRVQNPRDSDCRLSIKGMPDELYEVNWDLIMVDAPTGYFSGAPGRMTAIYTAGMIARSRRDGGETDVFVHDCDRPVEDKYSMSFLCEGYMKNAEGRLRHFLIPSQLSNPGSFCP